MPTPQNGYRLADGTRVPGTTTIISRFKESGGLIHWAWDLGMNGKDYRQVRDDAGGAGTLAHALVDAHIKKQPIDEVLFARADEETRTKAESAFGAFLSWERMTNLEIVETEMQLVSEAHRYGGTPDAIGIVSGDLCLVDWKSSNSVYADYLLQLAAYKNLWNENNPDRQVQGMHLIRFSKDHGDFSHRFYPELDQAWRAFVLCRELYELDKAIKKRVA